VHDGLEQVAWQITQLQSDIMLDGTWAGGHKVVFVAWMDVVRQFHAQMSAQTVGADAVRAVDDFLNRLADYDQSSSVYQSLAGVE
jgi:hypothetical protein